MPTGNMSSEPGGCTASNHRPEAIQCRCSVKLMLFFQVFCCQWHSRKVFQEGFVPLYCKPCVPQNRGHVPLYCRPCATTAADLVLLFCMFRPAKMHSPSYKSACPVLRSLCRLTVGPLPPHCRLWLFYCPCLLHCRPRAVPQRTLCCYRACLLLFECRPHEIKGRHMRYS